MKKLKYLIYSPRNNSGGVIALHNLCSLLSEQGEDAKVLYTTRFIGKRINLFQGLFYPLLVFLDGVVSFIYNTYKGGVLKNKLIIKKCRKKWFPFIKENTIVIYPEVVFGNPLRAKKVVRWLLYHNRGYSQDGEKTIGYDKTDLFFAYREVFNDIKLNPECRLLCTPYFDLDLYKQTNFGNINWSIIE